jgi:hypothetical protein
VTGPHDLLYGTWIEALEKDPCLRHLTPEQKAGALAAVLDAAVESEIDRMLDDEQERP